MLRHRLRVEATLDEVISALNDTDFVEADTYETLKTVRLRDGIGMLREIGGCCEIDLFDEDYGVEVDRMVEHLRNRGLSVDQMSVTERRE